MKISKETLAVLKHFAQINGNLALRKGSVLSTISPQRNVLASITIAESFTEDFYIYDLSQFLGVISLFTDPDIEFTDKVALIKEGKNAIKYYAADPSVLLLPPEKQIKFPGADVSFNISADMLNSIQKTSSVLGAPDLSIVGDGKNITIKVLDLKNSSNNVYESVVAESDVQFTANISISNIKVPSQDFKVELSSKKLSKWTAAAGDLTMYIALESSSAF